MSLCTCVLFGDVNNESGNFLSCAPCPPPIFSYNEFVSFAETKNLSTCEIGKIVDRCQLEIVSSGNLTFNNNDTDDITIGFAKGSPSLTNWMILVIIVSSFIGLAALFIL